MNRALSGAVLLASAFFAAGPAAAEDAKSSVVGWVQDSRGTPVSGAVVSLFAKGMRGGGFVTLSDEAGRFFLPALPAGSYTIRALEHSHRAAPAQQITLLPNQDFILSLSLPTLGQLSDEQMAERTRELKWLVRHKQRSVLEDREAQVLEASEREAPQATNPLGRLSNDLAGTFEFVANAQALGARPDFPMGDAIPAGTGMVRLQGRIADIATFRLAGLLAESEDASWRTAAEFTIEPGGGHRIETGAGYGSRFVRPITASVDGADPRLEDGSVGALFAQDNWSLGKGITLSYGARHSYVGFVKDPNHLDPMAALQVAAGPHTRLLGSATTRTLVPGGDLLTVSTLSAAPAIAYAQIGDDLRPERTVRYEFGAERDLGGAVFGAHVFREGTRDQLINVFGGTGSARSLAIVNGAGTRTHGVGFDLGRSFGRHVHGTVAYCYGHAAHDDAFDSGFHSAGAVLPFARGRFHDVSARVETVIEYTGTRLVAYYRINTLTPEGERPEPLRTTRFDVQVNQGLPYIGSMTGAEWDLLVAVRNLFYETSEGAMLDEVAVVNPPTRFLGGISVRF